MQVSCHPSRPAPPPGERGAPSGSGSHCGSAQDGTGRADACWGCPWASPHGCSGRFGPLPSAVHFRQSACRTSLLPVEGHHLCGSDRPTPPPLPLTTAECLGSEWLTGNSLGSHIAHIIHCITGNTSPSKKGEEGKRKREKAGLSERPGGEG